MPGPTPSIFSWPLVAAFITQLFPLVAMLLARRSPRLDPLAQIAIGFGILELFDLTELAQLLHLAPHGILAITFSTPVRLLLFTPPLLTLIGPHAKRWQPVILGATVVLSIVGMYVLGTGREFRVVSNPVVDATLSVMAVAAIFRMAQKSPGALAKRDWFWVLLGFAVSVSAGILWRPMAEFLVMRSWGALVDLHMGMVILQSITFCVIAFGILLKPQGRAERPPLTAAASPV